MDFQVTVCAISRWTDANSLHISFLDAQGHFGFFEVRLEHCGETEQMVRDSVWAGQGILLFWQRAAD